MPPAARITDMHVCPMVTGVVPHVGGPILPPGCPTVLIGMLPAARVTDMATCVGPPDVIIMGSPTVLIGNLMAARIGDPTAHGGVIVLGCFTVMIGEVGMGSPVVVTPMPPMVALAGAMNSSAAQALAQAAQDSSPVVQLDEALTQAAGSGSDQPVAPVVVSPEKKSWIEIELVDEDGKPVPYEEYRLKLPDGSTVGGSLDSKGQARVEGIDPGTCKISFSNFDREAWKRR